MNPFIRGLLDSLPPPESEWTGEARAEWLQAAAQIFKLIYKGGEDGRVIVNFYKQGENERGHATGTDGAH